MTIPNIRARGHYDRGERIFFKSRCCGLESFEFWIPRYKAKPHHSPKFITIYVQNMATWHITYECLLSSFETKRNKLVKRVVDAKKGIENVIMNSLSYNQLCSSTTLLAFVTWQNHLCKQVVWSLILCINDKQVLHRLQRKIHGLFDLCIFSWQTRFVSWSPCVQYPKIFSFGSQTQCPVEMWIVNQYEFNHQSLLRHLLYFSLKKRTFRTFSFWRPV